MTMLTGINGETIERIERIGTGASGSVYKAIQRTAHDSRIIALKCIHPHILSRGQAHTALEQEFSINQMLDSPHILRLHSIYRDQDSVSISMEYMEGGSARQRLFSRTRLNSAETCATGIAICRALEAAHSKGILHRDIKPHNILFDSRGSARLADFGIAHALARQCSAAVTGTADYCAPEIIRGEFADQRSDLYSLAACLFELCTGRPVFPADSPQMTLIMHMEKAAPEACCLITDIHPALSAAIAHGLNKDPADRYLSAEDFRERLERVQEAISSGLAEVEPKQSRSRVNSSPHKTCAVCGSMHTSTVCLSCASLVMPAAQRKTDRGIDIHIRESRQGGEVCRQQLRSRLLSAIPEAYFSADRLKKGLPYMPFTLCRNLSTSAAAELTRRLKQAGITYTSSSRNPGWKSENLQGLRKASLRKHVKASIQDLIKAGTIMLGGWYYYYFIGISSLGPLQFSILIPGAISLALLHTNLWQRRSQIRARKDCSLHPVLQKFAADYGMLRSGRIQAMSDRLAQRFMLMYDMIDDSVLQASVLDTARHIPELCLSASETEQTLSTLNSGDPSQFIEYSRLEQLMTQQIEIILMVALSTDRVAQRFFSNNTAVLSHLQEMLENLQQRISDLHSAGLELDYKHPKEEHHAHEQ